MLPALLPARRPEGFMQVEMFSGEWFVVLLATCRKGWELVEGPVTEPLALQARTVYDDGSEFAGVFLL